MTYLRCIGIYVLIIALVLQSLALWDWRFGAGNPDLSSMVIAAFAIGLIRSRKWGIWCVGAVGCLGIAMCVFVGVIYTFSRPSDFSMRIGTIIFTDPTLVEYWLFNAALLVFLWFPMTSVLTKLPNQPGVEREPIAVETAWIVVMVGVLSAAAAGIVLWAGVTT